MRVIGRERDFEAMVKEKRTIWEKVVGDEVFLCVAFSMDCGLALSVSRSD